jgi:hypothetical protein
MDTPHYHVAVYSEKTPSGLFCPAGRQNNIINLRLIIVASQVWLKDI